MNDIQWKERVKQEIEEEAAALEKRVMENRELSDIKMPEDSYQDLLRRLSEREAEKKPRRNRRRVLSAAAMVAVLVIAGSVGIGVSGAKLFVPRIGNRGNESEELDVTVNNDQVYYGDLTEEEAYEEIEEKLGIQALRLGYKPKGMSLEKVYIDTDSYEAQMEFYCESQILTVYENRKYESASINGLVDGTIVDTIELFYLNQKIEISEIDKNEGNLFYQTHFKQGNAYYYLSTDLELEEFEEILYGIIFENV